jgi:hypothetical protein
MGACSGHPAKRIRLLLLILGLVIVVAASGGNDAGPAATSSINPPRTSGGTEPPTSGAVYATRSQGSCAWASCHCWTNAARSATELLG